MDELYQHTLIDLIGSKKLCRRDRIEIGRRAFVRQNVQRDRLWSGSSIVHRWQLVYIRMHEWWCKRMRCTGGRGGSACGGQNRHVAWHDVAEKRRQSRRIQRIEHHFVGQTNVFAVDRVESGGRRFVQLKHRIECVGRRLQRRRVVVGSGGGSGRSGTDRSGLHSNSCGRL